MSLGSLALGLVLLALRTLRTLSGVAETLAVEATLRLLDAAPALLLRALADAGADVLRVSAVRLVRRLRGAAAALAKRGGRRWAGALAEAHEALHALAAAAVQLLAVVVRWQTAHTLAMSVLIINVAVGRRRVLLTVQALTVGRLRLHRARSLLGGGRRRGLGTRRALEDGWVLDEWLRHGVTRVVGGAVVLVLRVGCVVVRERWRVALLRTLATGLTLVRRLARLGELLRRLGVGRRKTRSTVGLLGSCRKALDVFVEHVAVAEPGRCRVGIVEVPLVLSVWVVTSAEAAEMRALVLVAELTRQLTEGAVGSILALRGRDGRGCCVEVWRLLLAEVGGVTSDALLRRRCYVRRLARGVALVEMAGQAVLRVLLVLLLLLRQKTLGLSGLLGVLL